MLIRSLIEIYLHNVKRVIMLRELKQIFEGQEDDQSENS